MKRTRFLVALAVVALIAAFGTTAAFAGPKWPIDTSGTGTAR